MEKYYYQLAGKRRKRCATEPYVSLATGNLCTTVSTVFADSRGERCIVCVDFKTDEDFYNIELRGLAVRSPVSAGADMNGMLTTLGEEIIKDSLTGAYNRRYIEERLPVDLYNAATGNRPLSVILIDIDRFKDVNDRFGHLAGDHVLKEFVTISRRCVRSDHDWVARYGGDEFLFVLGSANETAAVEAAEKIRTACARASVRYDGKTLHFTVSLGICTADAPQATVDELIGKADRNLYNAKKSGRNRTVHGSAELEKSS
jgi:diguanylate cyclase (GGDEF)-like protein